jgi:Ca2+-binding EF-hand superfamily protein
MLLVLRPTEKGSGKIPTKELEVLLKNLGYDFLITEKSIDDIKSVLDKDNEGHFNEDDLIGYLIKNYSVKYS